MWVKQSEYFACFENVYDNYNRVCFSPAENVSGEPGDELHARSPQARLRVICVSRRQEMHAEPPRRGGGPATAASARQLRGRSRDPGGRA